VWVPSVKNKLHITCKMLSRMLGVLQPANSPLKPHHQTWAKRIEVLTPVANRSADSVLRTPTAGTNRYYLKKKISF
jgi:hypothetical protein